MTEQVDILDLLKSKEGVQDRMFPPLILMRLQLRKMRLMY